MIISKGRLQKYSEQLTRRDMTVCYQSCFILCPFTAYVCVCVLQSETCLVQIPELDFEADMGTLGGKFTTVEGLLEDFKSQV